MNSNEPSTFISQCLAGDATVDEIDSYVENWHSDKTKYKLAQYLGLSDSEYAIWVEKPESIYFILHSRKRGIPLEKTLEEQSSAGNIAARATDARKVLKWLKERKRE